ncbi:2-hydroxychromene-2-carboxylate isomerase [Sneathiella glossodoripedis]|uniref:2-hydroxychromene-2-carboxylate isomerase n=1 Tax=Sneathiella glossodoripedis TaxID=418853 RepID=UPI000472D9CE|nr:2-hydroxychromene-2-carboxylate isomerase [Sneathiella glossodoripedis]
MGKAIEFFVEFSSPYNYIAVNQIGEVAQRNGVEAIWRPISLGHVWKAIGAQNVGPASIPQKMNYINMDSSRSARMAGLPMAKPAVFPVDAKLARLVFYRINRSDPEKAKEFARGVSRQLWAESREITAPEHLSELAGSLGVSMDEVIAAADDAEAKSAVISATTDAVESGCFGVPWFKVGEQVFWGADRIAHIDQYLAYKSGQSN